MSDENKRALWWRRNRVFFTHLLPMLLIAGLVGAHLALYFAPKQTVNVTRVYVVCPDRPHDWCSR